MALALCGLAGQDVAAECFPSFDFSGRGDLECLDGAAPAFHLGMGSYSSFNCLFSSEVFFFAFQVQSTTPSAGLPFLVLARFWQCRTSPR